MSAVTDRMSIEALLQSYAMHLDAFDFDSLARIFADDAVAAYTSHPVMRGASVIAEFLQSRTTMHHWMHHQLTVVHVALDDSGDSATTLTYFTAHSGYPDEPKVSISVGEYRDVLNKSAGRWQIAERNVHLGWREVRSSA